ncbi:hypothetical protein SAMN02745202_01129, partial [Segatella oulorum]
WLIRQKHRSGEGRSQHGIDVPDLQRVQICTDLQISAEAYLCQGITMPGPKNMNQMSG